MHPYVRLAMEAIREHVVGGEVKEPPYPLPDEFKKAAGAFVSIKKDGELRGCIGTITPTEKNLAAEIIRNAIASSNHDRRFTPVTEEELESLTMSVDVLSAPEDIDSPEDLNPKIYGVIVTSGEKRGLLLPDLAGIDTPERQIEICRKKGGIGPEEEVKLKRFSVERFR
jgi:AmmeMemoRadiSam system protein A